MLRHVVALASLIEALGWAQSVRVAFDLRFGRGPVRFRDHGKTYLMARDRSTHYHLAHSTSKLRKLAN